MLKCEADTNENLEQDKLLRSYFCEMNNELIVHQLVLLIIIYLPLCRDKLCMENKLQ